MKDLKSILMMNYKINMLMNIFDKGISYFIIFEDVCFTPTFIQGDSIWYELLPN